MTPKEQVETILNTYTSRDNLADAFASVLLEKDQEIERLNNVIEDLRMVVVKWNGYCPSSRQVEETEQCIAGWNKRVSEYANECDQLKIEVARLKNQLNAISAIVRVV